MTAPAIDLAEFPPQPTLPPLLPDAPVFTPGTVVTEFSYVKADGTAGTGTKTVVTAADGSRVTTYTDDAAAPMARGAFSVVTPTVTAGESAAAAPFTGLTDAELRAAPVPVTGPLTDAQLRAAPVPVTVSNPGLTDAQLRAAPLPVSGTVTIANPTAAGLTDAQLRAAPVPVLGPLTDTQLRAAPVPVSGTVTIANPTAAGLTDAQLRATAVPVSGPLTDAQLRATAVPTSLVGTGVVRTSAATTSTTTGTVAVGATSASFMNTGTANATVAGGVLIPGMGFEFSADHPDTLAAIAYVATGTTLVITTVR